MSPAHGSLLLGKCHSVAPHCISCLGAARQYRAHLVWTGYMSLSRFGPQQPKRTSELSTPIVSALFMTIVRDAPMRVSSSSSWLRPRSDTVCSRRVSQHKLPHFHIAVISYFFPPESLLHTLSFLLFGIYIVYGIVF